MPGQVKKRILCDAVFIFTLFCLPWWLSLPMGIIFAFFFDTYIELILGALLLDSTFSVSIPAYLGFHFILSLVSALCLLIIMPIRERLRFTL